MAGSDAHHSALSLFNKRNLLGLPDSPDNSSSDSLQVSQHLHSDNVSQNRYSEHEIDVIARG